MAHQQMLPLLSVFEYQWSRSRRKKGKKYNAALQSPINHVEMMRYVSSNYDSRTFLMLLLFNLLMISKRGQTSATANFLSPNRSERYRAHSTAVYTSVAVPSNFWAAPAPGVRVPGAVSDQIRSAPAPGQKRWLQLHESIH